MTSFYRQLFFLESQLMMFREGKRKEFSYQNDAFEQQEVFIKVKSLWHLILAVLTYLRKTFQ